MDAAAEKIFKMKFAKLTIMLNAVILLVAISILAFFGLIPIYSIQISAVCALLAVITAVYFARHYRQDKAWLYEQKD